MWRLAPGRSAVRCLWVIKETSRIQRDNEGYGREHVYGHVGSAMKNFARWLAESFRTEPLSELATAPAAIGAIQIKFNSC